MADRNWFPRNSKEDQTQQISKSIFLTNFPDSFKARDLWNICEQYGNVIDVYIPNRKSKAGKRFGFARFIKVDNLDRLIGNLCTVWNGRLHLHANSVRFERYAKHKPNTQISKPKPTAQPSFKTAITYAALLKGNSQNVIDNSLPSLVLDDTCIVDKSLQLHVMGKVKHFSSISNLRMLLAKEGFPSVKLSYIGGYWILLEFDNEEAKYKFMNHKGVASWFDELKNASADFVADERIVWVDIEGIPLQAWSRATFTKICSKWGCMMELEDNIDSSFARKRLCVKTKQESNILDSFKVIIKGRIYLVRAKELYCWTPIFNEVIASEFISDDESAQADNYVHHFEEDSQPDNDDELDAISETILGCEIPLNKKSMNKEQDNEQSDDPFQIYKTLQNENVVAQVDSEKSVLFPPGYTPEEVIQESNAVGHNGKDYKEASSEVNSRILETSQQMNAQDQEIQSNENIRNTSKVGGSIIEVMDEMIQVGKTMGYTMDGCMKDIENIIKTQGGTLFPQ